ncbi:MAG TPA: ABC transporter substrate-binding protein [Deltaproteobacteria bacterium]|nr:ABC transporter substrate-binding protein [Deltaproteobacteria bacterium]HPP81485.1 ABC transporter substrate-binding protein [Deltaproteobacteria bacterium]
MKQDNDTVLPSPWQGAFSFRFKPRACAWRVWATALVAACLVVSSVVRIEAAEPIRIAAIFSHTGVASASNIHSITGVREAVKEINDKGGLIGRRVELMEIDNKSTPIGSKVAAEKAASMGVAAIVGCDWSSHSLAAAPVAQARGIPMVSNVSTNDTLTSIGECIFRVCYTDRLQGKALALFASRDLKAHRALMLVDVSSDYAIGLSSEFSRGFTGPDRTSMRRNYTMEGLDEAWLERVASFAKRYKPDLVFIPGYDESAVIAAHLSRRGVTSTFLGGDGWGSDAFYRKWHKPIQDAYFSSHWGMRQDTPASREFIKRYGSGRRRIADTEALAYDAVMLLADAVTRAGSGDRAKILAALAETRSYRGVTGLISFAEGRDPVKDVVMLAIKDGVPRYHSTVNAR